MYCFICLNHKMFDFFKHQLLIYATEVQLFSDELRLIYMMHVFSGGSYKLGFMRFLSTMIILKYRDKVPGCFLVLKSYYIMDVTIICLNKLDIIYYPLIFSMYIIIIEYIYPIWIILLAIYTLAIC